MTWLDVGNGWRNLYLLSSGLLALALGTLFAARRLFAKGSRLACFLTGVAATPLIQYLWTLLLAFAWPHAPKEAIIGALPALAALCLMVMLARRARRLPALFRRGLAFLRRACRFDKPGLMALCFALCVVILLLPVCVRFCSSMNCVQGGDAGEYLALAERYCNDRSLGELLEKNETVGHFRGHSHFPSLELYMSYGLFHTGGDSYGYPDDKPVFTGLGLLTFYMAAAYLALLLLLCRERRVCVLLGLVLFNLVPNLYDSVAAAPRDLWRMLGVLLAMLVFGGLEPRGNWKRYLGKLLLSFAVCFTVMSTHVACFVVLPFVVAAWVLWRFGEALLRRDRTAGRTLLASLGVALAGAGGTVVAYLGNLWCFRQWGEMSPWRLMTTFTDAPWYAMYMDIEYKLDETTTHLNFFQSRNDILLGYATPVGVWGLRLAVLALLGAAAFLVCRRLNLRRRERSLLIDQTCREDGPTTVLLAAREDEPFRAASMALYAALLTLLTLAPMSGLLDSPLYSFSGAFLKVPRYTLQWFLLAAAMICAALAALTEAWPRLCAAGEKRLTRGGLRPSPLPAAHRAALCRAPLYLCALLCLLGLVQGTRQTGYADSFYRSSRTVMEDESILLDNGYRERYGLLTAVAEAVPEGQTILLTRVGYQYPLRGRGYLLLSNPVVPILNMKKDEIAPELERWNVAMIATEPQFWDQRYFPLTTLHAYLSELPPEQVVQTDTMRLYLLNPALVPVAQAALAAKD